MYHCSSSLPVVTQSLPSIVGVTKRITRILQLRHKRMINVIDRLEPSDALIASVDGGLVFLLEPVTMHHKKHCYQTIGMRTIAGCGHTFVIPRDPLKQILGFPVTFLTEEHLSKAGFPKQGTAVFWA